MNIQKIQTNKYNQNFGGLHLSKSVRKNCIECNYDKRLLNRIGNDKFAKKYEILINSAKNKINKLKTLAVTGLIGSIGAMGGIFAYLLNTDKLTESENTIYAILSGLATATMMGSMSYIAENDEKLMKRTYQIQCGSGIKKNLFGQKRLTGSKSDKIEFDRDIPSDISQLYNQVEERERAKFLDMLDNKYDSDKLNTPKEIYKFVKEFGSPCCMNYPLNDNEDTLLTRFFENKADESKEYKNIMQMLKETDLVIEKLNEPDGNILFNKIVENENIEGLKLIKNTNILYQDDIAASYDKISDKNFKRYFNKLHIDFSDWIFEQDQKSKLIDSLVVSPNTFVVDNRTKIIEQVVEDNSFNFISQLIDYIPDGENKKSYIEILKIVSGIKNINYNEKNSFGISLVESILNSENFDTLELLKGKNIEYDAILDDVYNNIQNQVFKSQVAMLNVEIPSEVFDVFLKRYVLDNKEIREDVTRIMSSPFRKPKDIALLVKALGAKYSISYIENNFKPILKQFKIWSPHFYKVAINELKNGGNN